MQSDPQRSIELKRVRSLFEERRKSLHVDTALELLSLKQVLPKAAKLDEFVGFVSLDEMRDVEDPRQLEVQFRELELFLIRLLEVVRRYELAEKLPEGTDGK